MSAPTPLLGTGGVHVAGGGIAALLAEADLLLDGEDILDTAGTVTSWPAQTGPTFAPPGGAFGDPTVVTVNGRKMVSFDKTNIDQLAADGDVTTTPSNRTTLIVYRPRTSAQTATGKREYLLGANNSGSGRFILGHTANLTVVPYNKPGVYDETAKGESWANGWHVYEQPAGATYVASLNHLQCSVFVHSSTAGESAYWRNGEKLGTVTAGLTQRALAGGTGELVLGSADNSNGSNSDTHYDGEIGYVVSVPRVLTDAEIALLSAHVQALFSIEALAYKLPNYFAEVTIWYQGGPRSNATTSLWLSQTGLADLTLVNSPTITADGVPDFDGTNQEGRVATSWGALGALDVDSYHVVGVVEFDAISTTSSNYLLSDMVYGDESGYLRVVGRDDTGGSGNYLMNVGHWDGSAANIPATWSPISLSTKHLFVARYDGTTVSFQIDDGPVRTYTATGDMTALTGLIRMAGTSGGDTLQCDMRVHDLCAGRYLDAPTLAALRTHFEAVRDAA